MYTVPPTVILLSQSQGRERPVGVEKEIAYIHLPLRRYILISNLPTNNGFIYIPDSTGKSKFSKKIAWVLVSEKTCGLFFFFFSSLLSCTFMDGWLFINDVEERERKRNYCAAGIIWRLLAAAAAVVSDALAEKLRFYWEGYAVLSFQHRVIYFVEEGWDLYIQGDLIYYKALELRGLWFIVFVRNSHIIHVCSNSSRDIIFYWFP